MILVLVILWLSTVLLTWPVLILNVEMLMALLVRNRGSSQKPQRIAGKRIAVLIPAHDEEDLIVRVVSDVARQLTHFDRLLVVADNCTDMTAEKVRAAGFETIERHDPLRKGKGYALDFGLRYLSGDPPDLVVIIDADCTLGPGTIDWLAAYVEKTQRPAQAFNVVLLPPNPDTNRRFSGFAWILKNHVRPAGLAALGLPCQLMGTGMAFPWKAIRSIDVATGDVVEDVIMGLDLAAAGCAPIFCPEARVESNAPPTERGLSIQRQRWEAGSLHNVLKRAPVMFLRGLLSLNVPLMAMASDLMVPPLMMLLVALMLGVTLSGIFAIATGLIAPFLILAGSLSALLLILALSWYHFGRDVLSSRDIWALPGIFVQKFGFYFFMWRQRGAGWIRTDRK